MLLHYSYSARENDSGETVVTPPPRKRFYSEDDYDDDDGDGDDDGEDSSDEGYAVYRVPFRGAFDDKDESAETETTSFRRPSGTIYGSSAP